MEVSGRSSKQLHRHAVPISMIIMASTAVTAPTLSSSNQSHLNTEALAARSSVRGVLNIQPTTNGLAHVTSHNQADTVTDNRSLTATGHIAVLSFSFQ